MPGAATQKLRALVTITVAATLLASCASLDESQCLLADFRFLGEEDGEKGRPRTRIDTYEKDCGEYGLSVDRQAYALGWEEGIVKFCTRDNGYEYGLGGNHYQKSCPVELADTFFNAYQLGRAVYTAKTEVERLETDISRLGDKLAKDDLKSDQRAELREDRNDAKDDLRKAERQLDIAEDEARDAGF